jgi:hypothetical protein
VPGFELIITTILAPTNKEFYGAIDSIELAFCCNCTAQLGRKARKRNKVQSRIHEYAVNEAVRFILIHERSPRLHLGKNGMFHNLLQGVNVHVVKFLKDF